MISRSHQQPPVSLRQRAALVVLVVVSLALATLTAMRIWSLPPSSPRPQPTSSDEAWPPKHRPPATQADPQALAGMSKPVERVVAAVDGQIDGVLPDDARSSRAQFLESFAAMLTAYDGGEARAFLESQRIQGFGPREDWDDPESYPRRALAYQAGTIPPEAARNVEVTPRYHRGRPAEPMPRFEGTSRSGTARGFARGPGDVVDPVAEGADVIEVSFPARKRFGQHLDERPILMRVWLAKQPDGPRWVVHSVFLEDVRGPDGQRTSVVGGSNNWPPL